MLPITVDSYDLYRQRRQKSIATGSADPLHAFPIRAQNLPPIPRQAQREQHAIPIPLFGRPPAQIIKQLHPRPRSLCVSVAAGAERADVPPDLRVGARRNRGRGREAG